MPTQKSLSPATSDASDARRSQATFRPGGRRPQVPSSDALAPPTSPSIITQRGSPSHRSVGVAEEMVYITLALPDATPGYSALELGDSPWGCQGLQHDCSRSPSHATPICQNTSRVSIPEQLGMKRTPNAEWKDFCIISTLAQNSGRGLVLCLPRNSFWFWPKADQDRVQPMSCSQR